MRVIEVRPAEWIRTALSAACAAVVLSATFAGAQTTQPAPAGQPPAAPAAQQPAQPADPGRKFSGQAGILFNIIKPEKTADFEKFLARVGEALQKSSNPGRQKQAAGWKVYKAVEPDPRGNVMYLYIVDPVAPGEDYTVTRIIAEAFPTEAQAIYETIKDAYAGQSILNLTLVQDFTKGAGAAPATGTTPPKPPQD
jgi:hypothetical protein